MKYMSLTSATETLKRFFGANPDSDTLTLQEIYIGAKRDLTKPEEQNKAWVANKLTHLKHYGLAKPVYSYEPRKMLTKVELTYEGKKVLGRVKSSGNPDKHIATSNNPDVINQSSRASISLEDIAQLIESYEKENPSIKLNLDIQLKKQQN